MSNTDTSTPTSAFEKLRTHLVRAYPHAGPFQELIQNLHTEYHPPYNPAIGWDTRFRDKREKQAYVPVPVVWFTVNVMSSLMGMRKPIFKMEPKSSKESDRADAADSELLLKYEVQRQNLVETHLDLCKVLSLKGRAALKVGYEGKELWTESVDNVENLWAEFADDSYKRVLSWSYHSMISPEEAKEVYGWNGTSNRSLYEMLSNQFKSSSDHGNALGLKSRNNKTISDRQNYIGVPLIEYYFKNPKGKVVNALFLGNGQQVDEIVTKLPDFPYIVVNAEVEPGNPFGIGDAEPVVMLQKEIATRVTDWAEAVRRNGQDQWKTFNYRGVTPQDLPGGGRLFPLGSKEDEDIEPLKFPIDNIGYAELLETLYDEYRRITGIPPEVLGGGTIPAASSGYAMAIRYQSVITRTGPRQIRLGTLYQTWARYMLQMMEAVDPSAKEVIQGNYFTVVDFDQLTPKDFAATVNTISQAVSSGLLSRRTGTEELGYVSEDEQQYMREYNSDPTLSPQTAMAIISVQGQMQAIAQGSAAAAGQQAQAGAEQAMPGGQGENQHTGEQLPMRDAAGALLGGGAVAAQEPMMSSPGTQYPPKV